MYKPRQPSESARSASSAGADGLYARSSTPTHPRAKFEKLEAAYECCQNWAQAIPEDQLTESAKVVVDTWLSTIKEKIEVIKGRRITAVVTSAGLALDRKALPKRSPRKSGNSPRKIESSFLDALIAAPHQSEIMDTQVRRLKQLGQKAIAPVVNHPELLYEDRKSHTGQETYGDNVTRNLSEAFDKYFEAYNCGASHISRIGL